MSEANSRQLGIKVGSLRRTKREYEMYLAEEVAQRKKIDGMKADEAIDAADVKKQIEVLNDTLTVIPDTAARLLKYATYLRRFLDENYKDVSASPEPHAQVAPDAAVEEVGDSPNAAAAHSTAARSDAALIAEGRALLRDTARALGTTEETFLGDEDSCAGHGEVFVEDEV
eukprot:gnl/TRDRNA2_/TRDRNA2_56467_c0_seq1.p1 gnl/TRDRNA2_/TRDRNA2_56467_c0~~gnl/TRDRNA2_/TRDRNA2_56467_c0_seq1.p1  ORF type:complete len:196 (+),score=38.09 gnl/TRDRNA2_/TRDRNA2_56467_c0_seq1:76-588(+)